MGFLILPILVSFTLGGDNASATASEPKPSHNAQAGPGLDHASWNGAMIVGPRGSLWGLRIGYLNENGNYVSDFNFYEQVLRAGPYAPDGSYAQVSTATLSLTWASNGKDEMLGKAEVLREGLTVIVEAYPAHDYPIRNQKADPSFPFYFKNPARFEVAAAETIVGTSPAIFTAAGDTMVNGGLAKFSNREERILGPEAGWDHFRLQAHPKPAAGGMGLVALDAAGAKIDTARIAFLKYEKLKRGDVIYVRAQAAANSVKAFPVTPKAVERRIQAARQTYEKGRLWGTGLFGKGAEPMCNEALWVRTYNPFEKTTWLTLGRYWQADGRYNVWGWDENCGAMIAAQFDAANASKNLVLAAGDERLGPLAAWSVYLRHPSEEMLAKVYPVYQKLYPPSDSALVRGGKGNGNVGKGMDDTPMRENWRNLGEMYSLDMSCMKAWSLEFLARMAAVLKRDDDANRYRAAHAELVQRINRTFWNEAEGIYRNRYISGAWPVTESPTSFYPWLAGAAAPEISERLLQKLLDPAKFWGEFVIVSLAKDDPQYGKQATEVGWDGKHLYPPYCYWRGNVWSPPTYMVYEGLKRSGQDEIAADYARKCINIWWKNWEPHGWTPENHHPETGMRSEMAHSHYIWGNLMPLIGIKELIDVEPWGPSGVLRFGSMSKEASSVHNWQWLGYRYDVSINNGTTTLHRDGKLRFKTEGGPCVVREFDPSRKDSSFLLSSQNELRLELYSPSSGLSYKKLVIPAGRYRIKPDAQSFVRLQ